MGNGHSIVVQVMCEHSLLEHKCSAWLFQGIVLPQFQHTYSLHWVIKKTWWGSIDHPDGEVTLMVNSPSEEGSPAMLEASSFLLDVYSVTPDIIG